MKSLAIASLLTLTVLSSALAGDGWMTDYEAAKEKAAKENKALLIDFTGSDWCGWCIRLREEVFDHESFKKGVAEHFILVELDYPRDKSKMSEETIAQNEKLKETYAIRGYPTIYLTDAEGRPFGKTGYQKGGPEAYLEHLATFREQLATRDEALAAAEKAEGEERAAALDKVLASVPQESLEGFYGDELEELGKLNPESPTILAIKEAEATAKLEGEFRALFQAGNFDEVVTKADSLAKEQKLEGVALQQVLIFKVNAYMAQKDIDSAIEVIDVIKAADPESQFGKSSDRFKAQLLEQKAQQEKEKATEEKDEAKISPQIELMIPIQAKAPEASKPKVQATRARPASKKAPKAPKSNRVLDDLTDEALLKKLQANRSNHSKLVAKVNESHEAFESVGKTLESQRKAARELEAKFNKARTAVKGIEAKLAGIEKFHNSAHTEEEALSKVIVFQEKEVVRRKQIAALENEAKELSRKAEALRKKAEQLKK